MLSPLMEDFKQAILSQKKINPFHKWEGNSLDYLELVHKNPEVANFAPGRIFNMIMKYGVNDVPNDVKLAGYEDLVEYKFFDGKIFGLESKMAIHDVMKFLKASARRTETGKRILIMVGPVASGKSTIAALLKRGLEKDDTPMFAIKGCPINEEPLHAIPINDRAYWEEKLGIKIEGYLCPHCRQVVKENYTDDDGTVRWSEIPVTAVIPSEQERIAIGTFQPSDPKSQDITELIGRVNMAKIARYGETDPRAFSFDGELQVANRGLIEYIEILKADIKFHYVLISAAQEQVIKSPGFPQIYLDELILSHTNQTEYDTFKSDKKNEALHDRMYKVIVPWNLNVSEEIEIYKKMIQESDFRNIHIAPGTLELAAQFAVLTRLKKSTKVSSLIEKMKLYDGRTSNEFKKEEVDIKKIREDGRRNGEGMDQGISPRFIINALNIALASKEDKNCINPIDVLRALKQNFDHHTGIEEQDIKNFTNLLVAEKDSALAEFREFAKKEINMAFLHAYDEQATELFNRYMLNVGAYCRKEKIEDTATGEYSSPDEKLMRSLEELIGVPVNSKDEFRNGIFVHKSSCGDRGKEFKYDSYAPLKEAIEKKLMSDLKNVVNLSIVNTTSTDPKRMKARSKAFKTLMEKGYCEHCANVLLSFVGEILRKQS
jgi:serine protein kinase